MFKHKFCIWLVDTLLREPMDYQHIRFAWFGAQANEHGESFSERSFRRYCHDAEALFGVDIWCDKRDGNKYKIKDPDLINESHVKGWLLSAFRMSNLARHVGVHGRVLLEDAPPAAHLLQVIIEAIDKKQMLRYRYKSHYHEEFTQMEIVPLFVKLFRQRWYVFGECKTGEKAGKVVKAALERTRDMEMIEQRGVLSKECKVLEDPAKFLNDTFGVLMDDYQPIETIVLRAFWPQDKYMVDTPLHHSQRVVKETEDYTEFELRVRTTYDFKQELMWLRDKVVVVSPESFRQTMIEVLEATLLGYKTGENHYIDE